MAGAPRAPVTRSPKTKGKKPPVYTTWKQILFHGAKFTIGSNVFGKHNNRYTLDYHTGQDIGMSRGTPVHTPMGGTVVKSDSAGAYGNNVKIRLHNGDYIFFAHLDSTAGLQPGDTVKAGTFIGRVGSTGTSTGPHLHLEIRKASSGGKFGDGNFYDPVKYLNGKKASNVEYGPEVDVPGSTTTTTTSSDGGDDGGGGKVAGFTKAEYYKWLDAKFGSIKILREMDAAARKEVGGQSIDWLVDELAKKKITDEDIVATYMNQTGWFKKYGMDTSKRLISEKQRPGFFKQNVEAQKSAILNAQGGLGQLGFNLSDKAMNQLARDSYVFGWSVAQAIDEAQKSYTKTGDVTYDGGTIGEAQDALEAASFDLGVNLSTADIDSMRQDVIDGKGYQSQLDALRDRSAQMYTVFSDQIKAGQSLRSVAGQYFQKAADLLELGSPDQIEMSDPLFTGGKAFMTPDPKTGQMTIKGMWDFEKEIRKDRRWLETQNARDTTYEKAAQVLQLMGLS